MTTHKAEMALELTCAMVRGMQTTLMRRSLAASEAMKKLVTERSWRLQERTSKTRQLPTKLTISSKHSSITSIAIATLDTCSNEKENLV